MQKETPPLLHPRGIGQYLRLYGSGIAMGAADLVPGVSGGTMALILGIYRALLEAIKSVNLHHLRTLLGGRILQLLREFPWRFLLTLELGILSAVFLLANVLGDLLENRPTFLYAFFAGMIIASILAIAVRVRWGAPQAAAFVVSTLVAYVVVATPQLQEADHSLPTIFLSGMLAICAMILPGISGSFILLILGQYEHVLGLVRSLDLLPLAVFAIGCGLGLVLFSRLLSWLLRHYEQTTMALLAGFMLGSLRLIVREASAGVEILPRYELPEQALTLALLLVGLLLVSTLDHLAAGENPLLRRVWPRETRS